MGYAHSQIDNPKGIIISRLQPKFKTACLACIFVYFKLDDERKNEMKTSLMSLSRDIASHISTLQEEKGEAIESFVIDCNGCYLTELPSKPQRKASLLSASLSTSL